LASSIERTQGQAAAGSGASIVDARQALPSDVSRPRRKAAPPSSDASGQFRPRNLGLSGEKPANMDVARGYYLDILV
jgi:hypothetical protein